LTQRTLIIVLALGLAAHLLLAPGVPLLLQALAILWIAGFLPGLLLVEALAGQSASRPDWLERILYTTGLAYAVLVAVMLGVSYLPGGPTAPLTLLAFDAVTLALFGWTWWRARAAQPGPPAWNIDVDLRWLAAGLIVLLGVAALVRFAGLGYSDYQGDEARAALRAAAVLQGYEDVLLLHKKGPTEILVPTVFYTLSGTLTEATARLGFAVANWVAVLGVFVLGWRLFRPLAGWLAALFLALDGYFIGFAHIVQYQSVVFLTSVLAVLILYRLVVKPVALARYLTLAALLLATGMLSHYEGALAALPAAFLLAVLFWQQRTRWKELLGAVAIAALAGGALLALFYVPYVVNPRFAATYHYLTDRRIGGSPPYNNLADVFIRTTLYSTTYYVGLLIVLTAAAAVRLLWGNFRRGVASVLSVLVVVFFALTIVRPDWAAAGGRDWIIVPFALLFGVIVLLPKERVAERMVWLWLGAVLILALFLTEKPRTHVYTFFMPWALLAGNELALWWGWLRDRIGFRAAAIAGSVAAAALILLFGNYAFWYFVSPSEVMLNYFEKRPPGYWVAYDEPDDKARFGFPLANGWKVIGELYRRGEITGPFETNEKEAWVPAWYTRGQDRCRRDAQWFFEIRNLEPFSNEDFLDMEHYLREGFTKWGRVQVDGKDKLTIYKRTGEQREFPTEDPVAGLPIFRVEDYAGAFDAAAGPDLPLTYPAVDPPIANPLHVNFGDQIWLEGYDIRYEQPLRPGDNIYLTLYWRADQPIWNSWKVFNQSYYGDGQVVAQRDGYPVCEGRETWRWDPGELITDPYVIPVKADAPDGLYPLYTGFYLEDTFERLPILDETGAEVATQYHLTDIRVGEE
jgi:4-amino-4-deoxy-L-arabinose transferase-like glycosyltransferase